MGFFHIGEDAASIGARVFPRIVSATRIRPGTTMQVGQISMSARPLARLERLLLVVRVERA